MEKNIFFLYKGYSKVFVVHHVYNRNEKWRKIFFLYKVTVMSSSFITFIIKMINEKKIFFLYKVTVNPSQLFLKESLEIPCRESPEIEEGISGTHMES